MLSDFKGFLTKPIDIANLNPAQWFLFFGFLIAVAAGWRMILNHVEG